MSERPRERRDKQYPLRLTESEREAFEQAARDAGLSLADWIRTTCLAAARKAWLTSTDSENHQ